MKREKYVQRLLRVFTEAGYTPLHILTVTPEEMVEIPGITVPNIRSVLFLQGKVLTEKDSVRKGQLIAAFLQEVAMLSGSLLDEPEDNTNNCTCIGGDIKPQSNNDIER